MNAIHNYINALFSSLPKTPTVLRLQAEMMENMDEKYQDLLREGKSENEAVGLVLASIGSAEDLKAELGIADEAVRPPEDNGVFLAEYTAFQKKFAIAIACGVVLCICACIGAMLCDELFPPSISDAAAGIVFFVLVGVGVAIFVYFGIRSSWYDEQYKIICGAKPNHSDEKSGLSGVVSSILFPLAAMFYLYIGFCHNLWHPGWIVFPVCSIIVGGIEVIGSYRHRNQH